MRAKQSFANSTDEMRRLASAAAAWLSVQSRGSLAFRFEDVSNCAAAAVAVAPASKLRLLNRSRSISLRTDRTCGLY